MTDPRIEAVARAICRSNPNYRTWHMPGDTPRKWKSSGGAIYETSELPPKSAEVLRNDARAALQAADKAAWQTMETAPRDGTRIMAAIEGVDRAVCVYWNGAEWLTVDGNDWRGREIYAWQPLPTPPEGGDD